MPHTLLVLSQTTKPDAYTYIRGVQSKQNQTNAALHTYIHAKGRTDTQTDRQTGRQAGRQTDRQAGGVPSILRGYRPFYQGTVRFDKMDGTPGRYRPFYPWGYRPK